ncbi:MAG: four helix bundle protein [Candidatus Cloacimonetes bacterium]|nr:four helix bundle protein [Candidatus Cloacimonadota bacterium]
MPKNEVKERSMDFALRIVKLYQYLCREKNEYVISRQVLKSGTAIGALVREAEFGESKADFVHKMSIALKEANETEYWLILLVRSSYLTDKQFDDIGKDIDILVKLLVSIVKTGRGNMRKDEG